LIFVTIGSMFPFDRLIREVDAFAARTPGESFFAQTGEGGYEPANMAFAPILAAKAFSEKLKACDLVVAHAGMGSVISAMEAGKPIVILPRKAALGEVTTDHQLATARWLEGKPGLEIAYEEAELPAAIERAMAKRTALEAARAESLTAFIEKIRNVIECA
jgi:UDP-N-acetylglucosamine transferase subunit ALG13